METEGREPRYNKKLSIVIYSPYGEGRIDVSDVSLGGACLKNVQRYYPAGEVLSIEIMLTESESIFCNARVLSVYPNTKEATGYRLNIQFIDMADRNKKKLRACLKQPD